MRGNAAAMAAPVTAVIANAMPATVAWYAAWHTGAPLVASCYIHDPCRTWDMGLRLGGRGTTSFHSRCGRRHDRQAGKLGAP